MKKILIVSPSFFEAKGFIENDINRNSDRFFQIRENVWLLISGIGIQKTGYYLQKVLSTQSFDLILNIGLAGSFTKQIPINSIVNIMEESYGDLGVSYDHDFETLLDLNLEKSDEFPFKNGVIENPIPIPDSIANLQKVRGITVNSLLTNKDALNLRKSKFGAQVESMEGATVFYICSMLEMPFLEIRIISNMVGERDKTKWSLSPAVQQLTAFIKEAFKI